MAKKESVSDSSAKAYVYTPGLKIKRNITIKKLRRLPIKGSTLVTIGDKVSHDTILAEGFISGDPIIINPINYLDCEPQKIKSYMLKKVGEKVKKGEILAKSSFLLGLFKNVCVSPIDGTVEFISDVSGQIIIRTSNIKISINAY
ncbi:MAG: hypothetical protein NTY03_04250, partial [Candidatus Bathyarchaeota archaeon]|nr:hypothetical protein [Candidatus Bathyarchaeota archaeon]